MDSGELNEKPGGQTKDSCPLVLFSAVLCPLASFVLRRPLSPGLPPLSHKVVTELPGKVSAS